MASRREEHGSYLVIGPVYSTEYLSASSVLPMLAEGKANGNRTVASTAFAQSHWSYMIAADSVYGKGVSKGVLWAARLIPLSAILFAVGAVVTPLGLYQTSALGTSVQGHFGTLICVAVLF